MSGVSRAGVKHVGRKVKLEEHKTPVKVINDMQSQMGQFGWPDATTDIYYGIPYILRDSIKYFAVQMILAKDPIQTLVSRLDPAVYKYFYSVTENATSNECGLLNEINRMHCDGTFGDDFTTESLMVNEADAYELYEFLDTCYRKLTACTKIESNKIGFIQFSFPSPFIPFVQRSNDLFMPWFCFLNANHAPVDYISGWDLAYLKFCCMYQGIQNPAANTFPVVSLSYLLSRLSDDTHYVTCWPSSSDHQLLTPVNNIQLRSGRDTANGKQTVAVTEPKSDRSRQKRRRAPTEKEPSQKVHRTYSKSSKQRK